MKTPINKSRLSTHWTYNWWKYLLSVILVIFGWSLIYTTTAPRVPAEYKIDLYIATGTGDTDKLDTYLAALQATEFTDMQEMSSQVLLSDDYYSAMQISTYVMAGEGDVYLMPTDTFRSYATGGAFLPLENYTDLVDQAETAGIATDKGWRTEEESGESHLYGIPVSTLTGLSDYSVSTDGYLCVLASGGNVDNSVKLVSCLIRDMQSAGQEESSSAD